MATEVLRGLASVPDDRIDLAEAALALAALDVPEAAFDPYRHHLAELAADLADMAPRDARLVDRVEALHAVLVRRHGYQGDRETYEDMQNANLMRVIDRRRGLPVALGILFLHAARAHGWEAVGLNFPGHFLIRLDCDGERVILDPFNQGEPQSIQDLRELLKQTAGDDAELQADHYAPVGNREILVRLQNNLKLRHLRNDRPDLALAVIEAMLLFAPDHPALWREAGLLNAHIQNFGAAIRALETFQVQARSLGASPSLQDQTAKMIQQLRYRLN